MDGLKAYLTEPSLSIVETTIKQLKDELDYDSGAIHQLQFAICLYQVSVFKFGSLGRKYWNQMFCSGFS